MKSVLYDLVDITSVSDFVIERAEIAGFNIESIASSVCDMTELDDKLLSKVEVTLKTGILIQFNIEIKHADHGGSVVDIKAKSEGVELKIINIDDLVRELKEAYELH